MFFVKKQLEISASHRLNLEYESKCCGIHGHNWIIEIYCVSETQDLNQNGMVIDFTHIKEVISDKLDHKNLNEVLDFNPTAENMAKWICEKVDELRLTAHCYKVTVQESIGNVACYVNENLCRDLGIAISF